MTDLQQAYLGRAERALAAARRAVEAGDGETAANRAYYACFYVALAALAGVGEEPRSHSGAHRRFAARFVATGALDRDTARILSDAFRIRHQSDYDAFAVTDLNAASDLLADVERFVAGTRRLVV